MTMYDLYDFSWFYLRLRQQPATALGDMRNLSIRLSLSFSFCLAVSLSYHLSVSVSVAASSSVFVYVSVSVSVSVFFSLSLSVSLSLSLSLFLSLSLCLAPSSAANSRRKFFSKSWVVEAVVACRLWFHQIPLSRCHHVRFSALGSNLE